MKEIVLALLTAAVRGIGKVPVFLAALPADNLFAQKGAGTFLRAGLVFVLGFIHLVFPQKMLDWESEHLFKDTPRTKNSLLIYRIGGAAAIVISIIIFLTG